MKLLKIGSFLLVSVLAAHMAFAAVVNIADTPFSSRSATGSAGGGASHTSTGVGGTVCGADAVDSASECNTLLGIDDAVATSCDGGKFNCSCPAEYSHSCVVGTGASCEGKFKSCSQYQGCDTIIASYNGGGVEVDSVAECQTIQGQDFYKALNCTNGAGENKFACIFPSCDDLQTQTYREYNNPSQADVIAAGGVMSNGSCWKNGVRYSPWYCDTAVYTTDEMPECPEMSELEICYLEKTKKYKPACVTPLCDDVKADPLFNSHGTVMADEAACQTAQGRTFWKAIECMDASVKKVFCAYPACADTESKTFTTAATDAANTATGGVVEGRCVDAGADKYPWYCQSSYGELAPTCVNEQMRPLECPLEKVLKYKNQCDYPLCEETNRTVNNLASSSTCPTGTIGDLSCYLKTGQTTPVKVCRCDSSVYPYTIAEGCDEAEEKDPADTRTWMPVIEMLNNSTQDTTSFCEWDSQTALNRDTGKSQTSNSALNRYKKCLPACPAEVSGSVSPIKPTCTNGTVLENCALGSSLGISAYYCACPKDYEGNDLYNVTCPAGTYGAGRTCQEGGNIIKYEFCLPKCDTSSPRKVTGNPVAANCENISQGAADEKLGSYVCASKSGDAYTAATCSYGNNMYCCQKDSSIDTGSCTQEFIALSENGSFGTACIPAAADNYKQQLCVVSAGKEAASWQCACNQYYSDEECGQIYGTEYRGAGKKCDFDLVESTPVSRYEACALPCPDTSLQPYELKDSAEACNLTSGSSTINAMSKACYQAGTGDSEGASKYICYCPAGFQTLEQYCAANPSIADCLNTQAGIGVKCTYDLADVGDLPLTPTKLEKYGQFGTRCPLTGNVYDSASAATSACGIQKATCYDDSGNEKAYCKCDSRYKTVEEHCKGKYTGADEITKCISETSGKGEACTYDAVNPYVSGSEKLVKYAEFAPYCPDETLRPNFADKACKLDAISIAEEGKACYRKGDTQNTRYLCTCPPTFVSECVDANEGLIPAGKACNYEGTDKIKYEGCFKQCSNTALTPVVSVSDGCPMVNGVNADTEECYLKAGDTAVSFACRCPASQSYKTLKEFCRTITPVGDESQEAASARCLDEYVGVGTPCTYDVDENGLSVDKYKSFDRICPADRPLFYTKEECSGGSVKGVFDGTCHVKAGDTQERVLCRCPASYVTACTKNGGATDADGNPIATQIPDPDKEPAGISCNFEGDTKLKYQGCYTKCDTIQSKGVEYMSDDDAGAVECTNKLGDGAFYGVKNTGTQCSKNHVLSTPCYCDATYVSCETGKNQRPADNAKACTINGETFYSDCANNECEDESATLAWVEIGENEERTADAICKANYGTGSTGKKCGENKIQCSCNAREFTETCDYPYDKPDKTKVQWCKYSSGGGLMKNGTDHFKLGECKVKPMMALCGKHIIDSAGNPQTGYVINVTSTEGQCTSQYGTGAKTQLCEYENDSNKRAFNCYYRAGDFTYTESNCPVRHVLDGGYIVKGGVKYYANCNCHPAYKQHKFNCAGMLSGGACTQKVTSSMVSNDDSLTGQEGSELAFYPYCQCTADYKYECDGERNVGVGTPCNGKYTACECKPDELPENWADNYYGCPGGKQPTGVIKPNGCGGKYYQCSVTECTWQHTQKCQSPLIGIDPCQDNLGNIGGYKSCKCPDGYNLCADGKTGKGEPCILNGKYYYQSCGDPAECVHGESRTCQGEFQVGVNPCLKNGITYFQYCTCSQGYDKLCYDEDKVGEGASCKLDGKEYYSKCVAPSNACTSQHQEACDSNQEKYDPCVNSDKKIMYKCKCPTNYKSCPDGGKEGAASCTDANGTVYAECAVSNTCNYEQKKNYKVCTSSQKGIGGSCVDSTVDASGNTVDIIKYAQCEDTDQCRVNGYQYTCMGFDQSNLGDDFCTDDKGNRLYKQCKCPTSWIPCPGKNNTKGTACTPQLENGSTGTTVYSSCTCDEFRFRYECKASDSGNKGVIPASSKSCTPRTYKEGSEYGYEEGGVLYESCDCSAGYTQTCKGNGQVGNDSDYCEKVPGSGTKLYRSCSCENKYSLTCDLDATNPGMSAPSDPAKICIAINEDGSEADPKYTSCECGKYYDLACDDGKTTGSATDFCRVADGAVDKTTYRKCSCDRDVYRESCQPNASGANTGVTKPENGDTDTCVEKISNGDNGVDPKMTNYYKSCRCAAGFGFSCAAGVENYSSSFTLKNSNYPSENFTTADYTAAGYVLSATEYCATTSGGTKYYKSCTCDPKVYLYKDCKRSAGADKDRYEIQATAKPCLQVDDNGVVTKLYRDSAEDCKCEADELTSTEQAAGWQEQNYVSALSQYNDGGLRNFIAQTCGHRDNFDLLDKGCGKIYYRCVIQSPYIYDSDKCKAAKTDAGSVDWVLDTSTGNCTTQEVLSHTGGRKNLQLCKSCKCPDGYPESRTCAEIGSLVLASEAEISSFGKPYCYRYGHAKKDNSDSHYKFKCNDFGSTTLVMKNGVKYCNINGTKYYPKEYCQCNSTSLPGSEPRCYSSYTKSGQWCSVCVDSRGSHVRKEP